MCQVRYDIWLIKWKRVNFLFVLTSDERNKEIIPSAFCQNYKLTLKFHTKIKE